MGFVDVDISIHAPRAGSDKIRVTEFKSNIISIHAPRAGSDRMVKAAPRREIVFQSTLPVRGATGSLIDATVGRNISIHAPRAGSDYCRRADRIRTEKFQSTLPVRGATLARQMLFKHRIISIHAPRAGSDDYRLHENQEKVYFNPRSPCGERPTTGGCPICSAKFQSTLPVRGATYSDNRDSTRMNISIHAPRAGSDYGSDDPSLHTGISIHAPRAGSD